MLRFLSSKRWEQRLYSLPVCFIIILFSVVYGITVPTHLTGYADSEELVVAAYEGGVAHPPGYPLLTFILRIFMRLSPLSPVYTANLVQVFFQVIALSLLYSSVLSILRLFTRLSPFLQSLLSTLTVMVTGFSYLYWLTGTRSEVTSLSNALTALVLCSFTKMHTSFLSKQPWQRWFHATLFFYGVALSHMQTVIFFLPGFVVTLYLYRHIYFSRLRDVWRVSFTIISITLLGFALPYLLMVFQNSGKANFSWYFPQSLTGVINHITRRDYSGSAIDENAKRTAYWVGIRPDFLPTIVQYPHVLMKQYGFIAPLLLLFSGLFFITHHSGKSYPYFLFFLCGGIFLFGYMGFPVQDPNNLEAQLLVGVGERQYALGFTLGAPLLALGFAQLVYMFRSPVLRALIPSLIVALSLSENLPIKWESMKQANLPIVDTYAREMMSAAKPGSVIICGGDISCFSLSYLSMVEKVRSDVQILFKSPRYQKYFLDRNPQWYGLLYKDNPDFVTNLIAWNLQTKPVYLTNPTDYYISYMGLNGNPFFLKPVRYAFEVAYPLPTLVKESYHYSLSTSLLKIPSSPIDSYANGLKDYFTGIHVLSGTLLLQYGDIPEARNNFNIALALSPHYQLTYDWLQILPTYQKNDFYSARKNNQTATSLMQSAQVAYKQKKMAEAFTNARLASYLQPKDANIRLLMADTLLAEGYDKEAETELRHILLYEPDNQVARERLYPILEKKPSK